MRQTILLQSEQLLQLLCESQPMSKGALLVIVDFKKMKQLKEVSEFMFEWISIRSDRNSSIPEQSTLLRGVAPVLRSPTLRHTINKILTPNSATRR